MRDVLVAGVGMTAFGKSDRSVRSLSEEALYSSLADAGVEASAVEMAVFANAVGGLVTGQEMIPGQSALRRSGLLGIPLFNVENACASAASAFHLAWMAVGAGMYDVAVAVGAEKLTHEDKRIPLRAIGSAVDLEELGELQARVQGGGDAGATRTLFMDIYADIARRYMERTGASVEDLADVSVKNHHHGSLNPFAQYREVVTREQVLASRAVAEPLTLLMCSPLGDGAAAAVLVSRDYAARLGTRRAVRVGASVVYSGSDDISGGTAVERAAATAYERAGVGPQDLDVVEVHDAAAPAELIVYEELGLCGEGLGASLLSSGDTSLGGRVPVNPSGGLLSKGHPIGATGLAQLVELVWQLRGEADGRQVEDARVALAENGGGWLSEDAAVAAVTILIADGAAA